MKLELNLLELNELYLATSRLVEQNQKHLDELGKNVGSINYFKTQLDSSKVLRDKIQTALYAEAKVLDEAREWVLKYKAEQYDRERDILKNAIDEEVDEFTDELLGGDLEFSSHFVSNEEADEDAGYKPKGVTQSILDYVEFKGEATYTEMHNFYRITFGSNSFSHILISLVVPYKNRLTRRYLHKKANGKYVVRVAGLHNWVEKDY